MQKFSTYASPGELLANDVVTEAFGEDEVKMLNSWKAAQGEKKEDKASYTKKNSDFKTGVAERAQERIGVKKGKPDKRLRGLVKDGTRAYGPAIEANILSEKDATAIMPPDGSVKKSPVDNRWRVAWSVYTISRSWSMYGEVHAFFICAAFCWHHYTLVTGIECPHEFLKEISWE